jgi:acetolactate synthase I/II/III large subunit
MSRVLTTAQVVVDCLIEQGVDTVFGIPGVHTYHLFDALYERRDRIRFIGARHEQGAAYMAYGYAQASGKVGVYTCVPGPGVLNTGAALATAYSAHAPVLCLTSEIPTTEIGRGHGILHELPDQLGLLRGLTKWSERIDHPTVARALTLQAFAHMTQGRVRPVALEIPWDVMGMKALVNTRSPAGVAPAAEVAADPAMIRAAADIIAGAAQPLITLGSGALRAGAEVRELAKLLQAPVTAHRSGRGVVPDDSEYALSHAAGYRYWGKTDVLIAIGTRMELQYFRWKAFPKDLRIVRIDIDPQEMSRRKADVGIVCDAAVGVRALLQELGERAPATAARADRRGELAELRAQTRRDIESVQPQVAYLDVMRKVLPREGFFVEEISQVGFTARFAFPVYSPRSYVSGGYQENLGFGFMTALGVKAAFPDRPVLSITGDGGFMFGVQELATAVQFRLPITTVVFNNQSFGNVVRDQKIGFGGRYLGGSLQNPDFVKLAESFGVRAARVATPAAFEPALREALASDVPNLIEVTVEPGSEVSPWPFIRPNN